MSPLMVQLLVAFVAILFIGLLCVAALFALKRVRLSKKQQESGELPMYHPNAHLAAGQRRTSNHRRLTITASPASFAQENYRNGGTPHSGTAFVYDEKKSLFSEGSSPPPSPVPEIRITFPEETDEAGRRTSGRVVVVRMGESTVGLEPLQEDLPPYERTQGQGSFHSLDLDRMGGLKEKETSILDEKRWS
jgi:hypothetical protein